MNLLLWLIYFQVKHFIADFFYQPAWMLETKGIYMHQGGLAHSGFHAALSFGAMASVLALPSAAVIAFCEFLIHYHIDWAKTNINAYLEYSPTNSANFWRLLGLDQLLHQLTYVAMLAAILYVQAQ